MTQAGKSYELGVSGFDQVSFNANTEKLWRRLSLEFKLLTCPNLRIKSLTNLLPRRKIFRTALIHSLRGTILNDAFLLRRLEFSLETDITIEIPDTFYYMKVNILNFSRRIKPE